MPQAPFYALIVPQDAPPATQPPGIWAPTFPTNPIAEPPWGWGARPPGVNYPTFPSNPIAEPPWGWGNRPPVPPHVWRPTFPTNPIAEPPWGWGRPPSGPPLGTWGGSGVGDYIDAGLPGPQPGGPTHIWGGPYYPPEIWRPTFPTNPIVIPPEEIPPQPVPPDKMVLVVWVPGYGYKMVVVPKPPMPPGYNPPTGPSTERPTPVK